MTQQNLNHVLNPEDLPQLYEKLGLPMDASIEDVMAAIDALMGAASPQDPEGGEMPGGEGGMVPMSKAIESHPIVVSMKGQLDNQASYIAKLERNATKATFQKMAEGWTSIAGTPEELAEELTSLHETAGPEVAQKLASHYQAINEQAASVATRSFGKSRNPVPGAEVKDDFEDEVSAYADKHDLTFDQALAHFANTRPAEVGQYRRRVNSQ